MMRTRIGASIALLAAVSTTGVPATLGADIGVAARAGTQGLGAEVGVSFTKWVGIRAGYYGLTVSDSLSEGGIDYDGDLEVGGGGLLADFYPFRGRFRLTAGLFSNNNEIRVSATPTANQEIGGNIYTPAEIGMLRGKVMFNDTAPYLGIGWGNISKGHRIGFLFDAGVLKQGSADVRLEATSPNVVDMAALLADLRLEASQVEDDIQDYDFWPVISFGLAIRF
ncbi:MAG: hypothetical protein ACE5IK_11625 [Acidobacteriota bacterium]